MRTWLNAMMPSRNAARTMPALSEEIRLMGGRISNIAAQLEALSGRITVVERQLVTLSQNSLRPSPPGLGENDAGQ